MSSWYTIQASNYGRECTVYSCGDNQSVLVNAEVLESALKNKYSSLECHLMREGVPLDEHRTTYVITNDDESDLLTKALPFGEKRRGFVRKVSHNVYSSS